MLSNCTNLEFYVCIFLGLCLIIGPIEEKNTKRTLSATGDFGSSLQDGTLGNYDTDGVPSGAPANAH
jgi:hypothetical protein